MLPVDVIVPIYKGLDVTRECLERALAHPQKTPFELILVNDASPEAGMTELLESFAKRPGVRVIHNTSNLGFVRSVNLALALHPDRDLVLLNSDAYVSGNWLDLMIHHLRGDQVASVTPFSNNASICSYPRLEEQDSWPKGFSSWDETQAAFAEANHGGSSEIPVGVGFCMAMKRRALVDCGAFNEELFGTGYGEEVEWCLRARRKGYRHLLAQDVFVAHVGSVSFGNTHRLERVRIATKIIEDLYPEWQGLLQSHIENPPEQEARVRMDLLRASRDKQPKVLHILHSEGGGIEVHLRDLALASPGLRHWRLRIGKSGYELECPQLEMRLYLGSHELSLMDLCRALGIARVHLHHLMHASSAMLEQLRLCELPLSVTLHDYYFFCPQVNLLNEKDRFCDVPPVGVCEKCISLKQPNYSVNSAASWRLKHLEILKSADQILAPAPSVKRYYSRAYPELESRIQVVAHPDLLDGPPSAISWPLNSETLRVLVLGHLDLKKGLEVVKAVGSSPAARSNLEIFHLGTQVQPETTNGNYRYLGPEGSLENIRDHCGRHKLHAVWIPPQWPETYSYVLSRALKLGLPIVATRLGALEDRLQNIPGVTLVDYGASTESILSIFETLRSSYVDLRLQAAEVASAYTEALGHDRYWAQTYAPLQATALDTNAQRQATRTLAKSLKLRPVGGQESGSAFVKVKSLWLKLRSSPNSAWVVRLVPRKLVASAKRYLLKA
jgi:GT2 family glycosyltransferase